MDQERDGGFGTLDYEPSYLNSYTFRDHYAPMRVGQWICVLTILLIPGINLLMFLFWAFVGSVNKNLQNFSRAVLAVATLGALLVGILSLILGTLGIPFPIFG